jgi:hypothetical protein
MTKLTIKPEGEATAAPAAARSALKVVEVTDSLGRRLKVRKLNALNKVDLAQVVGPDGCKNEAIIGPCAIAFSVSEIDGEPVYQPANYAEMRVLIGRLDDEGIQAATLAHIEHFGVTGEPVRGADVKN